MEKIFFDTSDLSPRDALRETLGDLPISGGWGYGPDDAIIIEDDVPWKVRHRIMIS